MPAVVRAETRYFVEDSSGLGDGDHGGGTPFVVAAPRIAVPPTDQGRPIASHARARGDASRGERRPSTVDRRGVLRQQRRGVVSEPMAYCTVGGDRGWGG